jgi:hypothetical protein
MNKKGIVAVVLTGLSLGVSAGLVFTHSYELVSNNDNGTRAMGTAISAGVGDVIVFSTSRNADAAYTYNAVSGDGGAVGSMTTVGTSTALAGYYTVTSAGTFNLTVGTTGARYATLGAYVLSSDLAGGTVRLLAQDETYLAAAVSTTNTLDYGSFALSSGVVVEAVSGAAGYTNSTAVPTGHSGTFNTPQNTRGVFTGTFTNLTAFTGDYIADSTANNSRTAGFAFTEVPPTKKLRIVVVHGP